MKDKLRKEIFNYYFNAVHSIAVEYYPYNADNLTVEIFKKKIFQTLDVRMLKRGNDHTTTIVRMAVNYCVNKRFEEIYEHYFPLVYAIACGYNYIDADDVTQDIFVDKILPAIKKKRFIEEKIKVYKGFIKKIAMNQCNTAYNRGKSHSTELIDFLSPNMFTTPSLIDPMILLGLALEDRLSRKEYIVIIMTIEGYNAKEIAKEIASTVTAVRQARYRARKKLR